MLATEECRRQRRNIMSKGMWWNRTWDVEQSGVEGEDGGGEMNFKAGDTIRYKTDI